MVGVDLGLGRGAGGAGFGVGGVAHAGGGVLGEDDLPDRPGFGGELALDSGHPVGALFARGQSAFAGAFGVVGFGAVLVEQEQGQVGGVLEFLGADADGGADQFDLELPAGGGVDEARHPVDGLADHFDVFTVDQPLCLGGGGRGQYRGQRQPDQRAARPQQCGFGQSAVGLAARDAPPGGEYVLPGLGAQLPRRGLDLQPGQDAVGLGGQLTSQGLQFVAEREQLVQGQRVQSRGGEFGVPGAHHRDALEYRPRLTYFEHTFEYRQVSDTL